MPSLLTKSRGIIQAVSTVFVAPGQSHQFVHMGNELSHPIVDKVNSQEYLTSTGLLVGASGLQGWRDEMEDTHLVIDIPSSPHNNHTILALFDGHGGMSTSAFVKENILCELQDSDAWKAYTDRCFQDKAPNSFRNYFNESN